LNPLYRARQGKSRREIERRADRWSRTAKHKPTKGTPGSAHGPGDLFTGCLWTLAPFVFADTMRTIFRYIPVNLA
jgi:hypothetical protein